MAMTIRPESARRAEMEISRSGHGTDGPGEERVARYRLTVRRSEPVASGLLALLPPEAGVAAVRRGDTTVVAVEPADVLVASGPDAFAALDRLAPGFWVGWCAFELGHAAERVSARGASLEARTVPDAVFARFDAHAVVAVDGSVTVHGEGPDGSRWSAPGARSIPSPRAADHVGPVASGRWSSSLDRDAYEARVETCSSCCGRASATRSTSPVSSRATRARPGRAVRRHRTLPSRAAHRAAAPAPARTRHRSRVGVARGLPATGRAGGRDPPIKAPPRTGARSRPAPRTTPRT